MEGPDRWKVAVLEAHTMFDEAGIIYDFI